MKSYDEKTTGRIWLTSDKRAVVADGDKRARFLLSSEVPVSRAKAEEIRSYTNGADFLKPVDPSQVPDEELTALVAAETKAQDTQAAVGPDVILDFGRAHKGKPFGKLPKKYLEGTLLKKPEYAAAAQAELDRRVAAKVAPEAPAPTEGDETKPNFGPEDTIDFGQFNGTKVKDLPADFLQKLHDGATEIHGDWTAAEIARRADQG